MTSLFSYFPKLLKRSAESEETREPAVFAAWFLAAGAPLAKVTTPLKLERKCLIVAVPDRTWQRQLKRLRGQALFKVNSLLGAPTVTSIEFVVNPGAIPDKEEQAPVVLEASEEYAAALRISADHISDPNLRDAFLRAAGKCLQRRAK